jgi:DNA-binding LacI/PurR family transcriptional regulator
MPTIADVAAHAGVGLGTVSRVLNGSPNVRETTRARVLAAIEALAYRPNPMAQGLSRGRARTLGVLVPFFTHASAVERLRGVVAGLEGSRYDLVLFNVESIEHRDEHLASLTGRARIDGLLILSLPVPEDELDRLTAAGVPIVLVDTQGAGVPVVATDDVEGGRIATRHLVELGHTSIGYIGHEPDRLGFTASARREAGYEQVLQEHHLPAPASLRRYGTHERDAARALTAELLGRADAPTAIFASSDTQALGVLAAAEDVGLRVPEELSVVGFDDVELSRYVELTTVRQPLFETGLRGIQLLLEALADGAPPAAHELLGLELVVRASTGPPGGRARRGRARRQGTFDPGADQPKEDRLHARQNKGTKVG